MPTDFAGTGPARSSSFESLPTRAAHVRHPSFEEQLSGYDSTCLRYEPAGLLSPQWSESRASWRVGMLDLGCAHSAELRNVSAQQMVWRIEAAQLASHWLTNHLTTPATETSRPEVNDEESENYNLADFHVSVPRRSMGKWKAKVKVTGRHEPRMVLTEDQLRALAELADADEQ